MYKKLSSCFLFICFLLNLLSGQNEFNKSIDVIRTSESIKLDGLADEGTWQKAPTASNFKQNFPSDSIPALWDTEVKLAYDDDNLYVFIKCHAAGNNFIVPSLKRDYSFRSNDNITILLDTYSDNTNALVFGMNPYGVRREATISNSGQGFQDFDDSWDNKWDGESKMFDNYWTCEMAIPFSTLRFSKGSKSWRFNCYRFDTQSNEMSTWMTIPGNRLVMDLGFLGNMNWEEPLKKSGKNISIIPYVSASTAKDFEIESGAISDNKLDAGLDAKIGITSGLNLDLTINPDFSQVEVDEQVTNIDRFELFFPEKRQFFIENADLFGRFGASRLNPFFSRRIGISIDPNTGQNIQNKIVYGARLSGKVNDKLRVGLLNMQTANQEDKGLPGFNYTVATAEQRISESGRIAFMGVNKQAINPSSFEATFNEYNRVIGAEYRLNSPDNTWTGKTNFMKSFTPGIEKATDAHFTQIVYNRDKYRFEWAHLYLGSGFITDSGFTPRNDIILMSPEVSYNIFPESGNIAQAVIGFDARAFWKLGKDGNPFITSFGIEEVGFEPFVDFSFTNGAMLNILANYSYIKLVRDFDPTRVQENGAKLAGGSSYNFVNLIVDFQSDQRKKLAYSITGQGGTFYNGSILGFDGSMTYRYQPFGFVSLDLNYSRISLEEPFETANLWIVGPRVDLTLSKELFFTTFVQYNSQFDNLNINSRFQWRFAPVSDFFIVYTDNYITDPWSNFRSRNRALVAKLTYWFNL